MEFREFKQKPVATTTRPRAELESEGYIRGTSFLNKKQNNNIENNDDFAVTEISKSKSLPQIKAKDEVLSNNINEDKQDLKPSAISITSKTQKNNIHKNHRSRLKAQCIEHGLGSLSQVQMLELLLYYAIPQKDTNPLAHKLLNQYGSLKDVLSCDVAELVKTCKLTESTALLISLVHDLMHQMNMPEPKGFIGSTADARAYCTKFYFGVTVEQFYVICLTKSNQIKRYALINSGTIDEVNVQIRNITEFAIQQKCNRIILSHNHPQGVSHVSDEDFNFTYLLLVSCLLNDIDILDHVVVGTDCTISMNELGSLSTLKMRAFQSTKLSQAKREHIVESSSNFIVSSPSAEYFKITV